VVIGFSTTLTAENLREEVWTSRSMCCVYKAIYVGLHILHANITVGSHHSPPPPAGSGGEMGPPWTAAWPRLMCHYCQCHGKTIVFFYQEPFLCQCQCKKARPIYNTVLYPNHRPICLSLSTHTSILFHTYCPVSLSLNHLLQSSILLMMSESGKGLSLQLLFILLLR
jgi:hypothetical protein